LITWDLRKPCRRKTNQENIMQEDENNNNGQELLDLDQIERKFGLKKSTIIRERWEKKKIAQKKKTYIGKNGEKKTVIPHNTSGFGFTTPAVMNGRKVMYRRSQIEDWMDRNTEQLSPQQRVEKYA